MAELHWDELNRGLLEAHGEDWTYLIVLDDHLVVLTRWDAGIPINMAAQAALYAIQIGGAYCGAAGCGTADVMIAHLKRTAQEYEAGLDVTGQPRWRHGYQPRKTGDSAS